MRFDIKIKELNVQVYPFMDVYKRINIHFKHILIKNRPYFFIIEHQKIILYFNVKDFYAISSQFLNFHNLLEINFQYLFTLKHKIIILF